MSCETSSKSLLADIRNCRICAEQLPLGPRPILQFHSNARILIAGQAPGRKVHESGIPFDDASGNRLRDWLGIDRDTFYDPLQVAILPMGFCYPGTGKSGDLPPRPECAPAWRESLENRMTRLKCTLVIGMYAHRYHFNDQHGSLTDRVKAWKTIRPDRIPLPHPSPRNNIWLRRNPWFETEMLPELKEQIRKILLN